MNVAELITWQLCNIIYWQLRKWYWQWHSIAEFEEFDGLYYNQSRQSFCFTELKSYKFSYTLLWLNCRKIFKIFVLRKLHVVIRQLGNIFFVLEKKKCEISGVLFLYDDIEKDPNLIWLCDCFFRYGLQLIKGIKNIDELFSVTECLVITKLITAERVIAFGSDNFILCCDCIFYWFDGFINQQFVNCVDEIDDCQRVICINNLLTMSGPSSTRCERFSSDVIYFHEICDNCKKHYIKKIYLKFHWIKI